MACPILADTTAQSLSPDTTWKVLVAGNRRYVSGHPVWPHQSVSRREEVAGGQHPIAVVLSCSDSRVPPEIVFDQGLGDLFVVRVAGNVVDDNALGSIEYAVEHLGPRLIVVLGHQKCGAVAAAVAGGNAEGHVDSIVKAIQPAVAAARNEKGDLVDNAVRENVRHVVDELDSSQPVLAGLVGDGKVKVIGARYDLGTGKVDMVR
jgi:carbonic anhydrase